MTAESARLALTDTMGDISQTLANFVMRGEVLADARVSRFELESDMAGGVIQHVVAAALSLTRKQFLEYDPSYQTSTSQVLVEALNDIPELEVIDQRIREGDVPNDAGGPSVVAMAHAVGRTSKQIVAYRLKGPGIATRRAKAITLIPRDGVYRQISGEILYYEPHFDAFTCAGFAYFTTVTLIQTKLHADGKARQLAQATLSAATENIRIDGFAALEEAVLDDPTLRAKMAHVARLMEADAEYSQHLTTDRLIEFAEANPDYKILVSVENGAKALRFDASPQHRHQIPHLLADDYLHSYLTRRNYEAGSKQRMQA